MAFLSRFRRARSVGIDEPPPPLTYPNQPAGLVRICEADFSVLPGGSNQTLQNQVAGYWWRQNDNTIVFGSNTTGSNLSIVSEPAAPSSPPGVLRYRYPSGMTDGVEPVFFIGWNDAGLGNNGTPAYDEIYTSIRFRIEGTDYQNQSTGTKIFYINYGHTGRLNHSTNMILGEGLAGSTITKSAFRFRWACTIMNPDGTDPGYAYNFEQNVNTTALLTVGAWHEVETYMKVNTPGQANGILRYWIDGVHAGEYTTMRYISTQNPVKFHQIRYAPVFGGSSGEVRTRDDFIQVDHLYASGKRYFANEPAGYGTIIHHALGSLPSTGTAIAGSWWNASSSSDIAVVNDPSAPMSPSGAVRVRWPAGLNGGYSTTSFGGWSGPSGYDTQYKEIYFSVHMKFEGPTYENQAVLTKLWFFGAGQNADPGESRNDLIFVLANPQEGTYIGTSFPFEFRQQNLVARNLAANENISSGTLQMGSWYQLEGVLKLNTIGVSDGVLQVWVNGVRIMNYTNMVYRNAVSPRGFTEFKWTAVWGGIGGVKTRDDFAVIDNIYVSGVLL